MPRKPAPRPVPLAMTLRRWHGYIGALIAPTILFFAFTGILQLFSLHESRPGYQAPAWAVTLGNIHKDQVLKKGDHHGPPPGAGPRKGAGDDHGPPPAKHNEPPPIRTYVLKWEFTLVALGLITSTCFGLWIAFQDPRRRRLTTILLAVGTLLPLLTLFA